MSSLDAVAGLPTVERHAARPRLGGGRGGVAAVLFGQDGGPLPPLVGGADVEAADGVSRLPGCPPGGVFSSWSW